MNRKTIRATVVRALAAGALLTGVTAVLGVSASSAQPNAPATYYAAPNGSPNNAPCTTSAHDPCDLATAITEEASLGDGGTGNVISLAKGTYQTVEPLITGPLGALDELSPGNDNVTIKGAGKKTVLESSASAPVVLFFDEISPAPVSGVTLEDATIAASASNGAAIANPASTNDTVADVTVTGYVTGGHASAAAAAIALSGGQTSVIDSAISSASVKPCSATVKNSNINLTGWSSGILQLKVPACSTKALASDSNIVAISIPNPPPALPTVITATAAVTGPGTLAVSLPSSAAAVPKGATVNFQLTSGVPAYTGAGIAVTGNSTTADIYGNTITGGGGATVGIAVSEGNANIGGDSISSNSNPAFAMTREPGVGIAVGNATGGAEPGDVTIAPTPTTVSSLPGFPFGTASAPASDTGNTIAGSNDFGLVVSGQNASSPYVTSGTAHVVVDNDGLGAAGTAANSIGGTYSGAELAADWATTAGCSAACVDLTLADNSVSASTLGGVAVAVAGDVGEEVGPGNTISGAEFGVAIGAASTLNGVTGNAITGNADDGVVIAGTAAQTLPDYPTLTEFTADGGAGADNAVGDNAFSANAQANILDYTGTTEGSGPSGTVTLQQGTGLATGVGIAAGAAPTSINVTDSLNGVILEPGEIVRVGGANNCGIAGEVTVTCSFFVGPSDTPQLSTNALSPTAVNVITLNPLFDTVLANIPAGDTVTVTTLTAATSLQSYSGNTIGSGLGVPPCSPNNQGGVGDTAPLEATLGNPVVGYLDC